MRPATREGLNPGLAAASRCTDRIVGDPASDYRHRLRGRRAAGTITLTELKLKPPPSSPRSAPPCDDIDALEQALLISIRTAGLKPGRENQLAEEACRLRRRRKGWLEEMEEVLREWTAHASLIWELHEQERSKLVEDRRERDIQHTRSLALLRKQLVEERERVYTAAAQERETAASQLKATEEAHELWKQVHRKEISAATQREIARATARLRRDAEQHTRRVKESLEAEYADRFAAAVEQNEKSAARASAAEAVSIRLENSKRRLEAQLAEAVERMQRMERLSQTHKEVVEGEKVDLERRAQRLARRIEEERTLKETERLAHESGIRAIRAQWKEEFQTVDDRVRSVISAKDEAMNGLAEELETARQRAETAETLLEELQLGICSVASSPSRESRKFRRYRPHPPTIRCVVSADR